ncbi:unnamed protein product [Owenia fusiformis]|uniref:EGF-like domain-containing protein n=1 Tax=Owenia fusiformis TaxID=6347 RepID=A0A8S4N6F8_OWEFU|nr:unnamed protein product [Owenia fusiformis]
MDAACIHPGPWLDTVYIPARYVPRTSVDIDECASDPCLNEAYCTDRIDKYNCTCKYGFIGHRCEQYDLYQRSIWAMLFFLIAITLLLIIFLDVWMCVLWGKLKLGVKWIQTNTRETPDVHVYRPMDKNIKETTTDLSNHQADELLKDISQLFQIVEERVALQHNMMMTSHDNREDKTQNDVMGLIDEIENRLRVYRTTLTQSGETSLIY